MNHSGLSKGERRNLSSGWGTPVTALFPVVNYTSSLRVTFQQTQAEQMLIPLQAKTEIHSVHFLVLT